MGASEEWPTPPQSLGGFLRAQRQLADLSLRELAALTSVSNAYLSQVERGLHQPSVRVLSSIALALGVPPETLLDAAGLRRSPASGEAADPPSAEAAGPPPPDGHVCSVGEAVAADPRLTAEQRRALLGVYASFVADAG